MFDQISDRLCNRNTQAWFLIIIFIEMVQIYVAQIRTYMAKINLCGSERQGSSPSFDNFILVFIVFVQPSFCQSAIKKQR